MNGWSKGCGDFMRSGRSYVASIFVFMLAFFVGTDAQAQTCNRTITADVVALDMPLMFNRLGAQNINGMMFALKRDVVVNDPSDPSRHLKPIADVGGSPGKVTLRPDKRPRPLVLHTGRGDCLTITLTNLLRDPANPENAQDAASGNVQRSNVQFKIHNDNQVAARNVSLRFQGTELVNSINDDGSYVGENPAGAIAKPGETKTYTVHTPEDGAFLGVSYGGVVGGEGQGGQTASGLWAVLNVNATDAMFWRSSVSREDLDLATDGMTPDGQPMIDYAARYPNAEPWISEGKANAPILAMIDTDGSTVHTAIDAIVAYGPDYKLAAPGSGPHGGKIGFFPSTIYPLENAGKRNPTVPNRLEPFREFTVAFHDETQTTQVFPKWFNDPVLGHTLHGVRDSFMINYGSGGIGSEIIANRLGIGPMHDCVNCMYEEFFLTFTAVGEVGQVTDIPANMGLENCDPNLENCGAVGPKANYVLYPDDPSNVHHSYVGDSVAFRNLHAGPGEQHVFHLHNHQWLFNANDDNSNYLDAQGLGPGAGYAYWINFGGSGNRNKTAGDAIFHCHFYPHFAQGMWEMWRIHDAFESGTKLAVNGGVAGARPSFVDDGLGLGNGLPLDDADNRALPDGEIVAGAPTPSVVPLPGRAIAPMPAMAVGIKPNHNEIEVCADGLPDAADASCPNGTTVMRPVGSLTVVAGIPGQRTGNPGYPFWIAGMEHTVGNRPPTPPLDMITYNKASALTATGQNLWTNPGWADANAIDGWDGGLPRFGVEGYAAGGETAVAITRLDMSKEIHVAKPVFFPEEGTDLEQAAMAYHGERCHPTYRLDSIDEFGNPTYVEAGCDDPHGSNVQPGFLTNGSKPIAGAPFQDPCIDDTGAVMTGQQGSFFSGNSLTAMWDGAGMNTHGSSPFTAQSPRVYKAANVQFDAVLNKLGYHFPQQRVITLWQDVVPTVNQERPPEPMVLRMNTFDCTQYVHSNVVPKAYELDDYQVRTPTDIIGQHIHLPKWDLTSADGSANGFNYEDGTLSPQAVVELIHAINNFNEHHPDKAVKEMFDGRPVTNSTGEDAFASGKLLALPHPFFGLTEKGDGCDYGSEEDWCGARSTIQRWFADPVVNVQGVDRGLGIIFTHDHYGPSTHQQVGLYATVLIEPADSKWVHNETGTELYTRTNGPVHLNDGGPTSWQAAILTNQGMGYAQNVKADQIDSFREFYFEYTDFQHAYQPGVFVGMGPDGKKISEYDIAAPWSDGNLPAVIGAASIRETFREAVQPSTRKQASLKDGFPLDIWEFAEACKGDNLTTDATGNPIPVPRPCPEAITADDPGMYVVNYRNESLLARVYDPNRPGPDALPTQDCSDPLNRTGCGMQAKGKQGDLAFAMASNVNRAIPALNTVEGLAPATYFDSTQCSNGVGGTVFCPPITNPAALAGGDPFTPTMRVMDGDYVRAKMQAGGQEEEHTGTFYGLKWLQGGSGFGESKNSGWRNAQSGGISEQFALRMPVFADYQQRGNTADYLYSFNTSTDGWASGTWGIMRSYKGSAKGGLYQLPDNALTEGVTLSNNRDFNGVCPKVAPVRPYDLTAVSVNNVLAANSNVTIADLYQKGHAGAAPRAGGGTLVYNDRVGSIAGMPANPEEGELDPGVAHGSPIHDPTAIIYVNTDDLVALDGHGHEVHKVKIEGKRGKGGFVFEARDTATGSLVHPLTASDWASVDNRCYYESNGVVSYEPFRSDCPVRLRHGAPVEPVVVRAAAGECIETNLRNKVLEPATYTDANGTHRVYIGSDKNTPAFFEAPGYTYMADVTDSEVGTLVVDASEINWASTYDLANTNGIQAFVRRDPGQAGSGMTSFNNNLIQASAHVGMYPQLLELDVTRSYGINVGQNPAQQTVAPGAQQTYQWYAGHINLGPVTAGRKGNQASLVATPIELGGFGIMPADPIKQPQKGVYGAGAVYPAGSTWTVDAGGTTSATVTSPSGSFRDFTTVAAKGASIYYADSYPVENLLGEGSFGVSEDSQDAGGMAVNYGNEAMWLRYGKNPTVVAGNAKCNGMDPDSCLGGVVSGEAEKAFSNTLVGGDPQTAVFTVAPGDEYRMHVLMPVGPGRGSTFDLHGHTFQRDPYICKGDADLGIPGKCNMGSGLPGDGSVGSQSLGINPIGMYIGGIESWFPGQHYEIFVPKAGGANEVEGDYLFRDHMGLGNTGGLWGILRVEQTTP